MPYIDERRSQTPTLEHAPTVPTETSVQTNAPACRRHTHAETHIRPRTISTTRERDCPTHEPPPSVTGTCTCTRAHRGTRAEAHATRARRSVPEHTHITSSTDAQELTHACTHAHTHARAEATHNAMAPESPTAAGRGNTLAMGRVAARAASKGVRAKKTSSPPHTIHRHTRSNPCACMDRGHCKRYALHSCTCMRNRCTPVASAHRQREMRQNCYSWLLMRAFTLLYLLPPGDMGLTLTCNRT